MLHPGDTLGPYRIDARLKAGGMGTLYRAHRHGVAGFVRPVAIKVVHSHLTDEPEIVRMFVEEARLSAQIEHPNIVRTEELGEHRGHYYLVMEYVDGYSLAQVERALMLGTRPMPTALAVAIVMAVADALHAAHEARGPDGRSLDVVHRDVSPQNIMIDRRGHVKLIDFGIARAHGRAPTRSGLLRGKIAYMAPEQAFGRAVDRRVDLYALALVLWELLTRRRAFTAENELALLEQVRHPDIAPAGTVVPALPPALDRAITAALALDPADRPSTALAFRQQLGAAVPEALSVDSGAIAAFIASLLTTSEKTENATAPVSAGTSDPASDAHDPAGATATMRDGSGAVPDAVSRSVGNVSDVSIALSSTVDRPAPTSSRTMALRIGAAVLGVLGLVSGLSLLRNASSPAASPPVHATAPAIPSVTPSAVPSATPSAAPSDTPPVALAPVPTATDAQSTATPTSPASGTAGTVATTHGARTPVPSHTPRTHRTVRRRTTRRGADTTVPIAREVSY